MVKHESFSAAQVRSATVISFPWKRKGLFARMLDAMHQSRRIQARRVVRRYRHLISQDDRPGSAGGSDSHS
jgi:hypothetical protein